MSTAAFRPNAEGKIWGDKEVFTSSKWNVAQAICQLVAVEVIGCHQ
jgi:hypothetical protein